MRSARKINLSRVFDTRRPVSKQELELAVGILSDRARKDGLQPCGREWTRAVWLLRLAVELHNAQFG